MTAEASADRRRAADTLLFAAGVALFLVEAVAYARGSGWYLDGMIEDLERADRVRSWSDFLREVGSDVYYPPLSCIYFTASALLARWIPWAMALGVTVLPFAGGLLGALPSGA